MMKVLPSSSQLNESSRAECLTEECNSGQKWPSPDPHTMPEPRLRAAWGEGALTSDTVTDPRSDIAGGQQLTGRW